MNKHTDNMSSILKKVIRGILIAAAIVATILISLSILVKRQYRQHMIDRPLYDLQALAHAIERFESEYERLPDVSLLDFETEGPEAVELITVLLGKEANGHEIQNPRQIAFLTARLTKNRKQGGLVFSSAGKVEGMYDIWSNPLRVMLRPPGQSTFVFPHLGKQMTTSKSAVVLSRGQDQKWGTEDDLISETSTPAQKR